MERIKKVFTLIHLVIWLLLFFLFSWVFWSEGHPDWLFKSGRLVLILSAIFYAHFFILTSFLYKRKYVLYALGLILILRVSPVLFIWLHSGAKNWHSISDKYYTFLIITVFGVVLSWIARGVENRFINSLKKEKLEKQSIQAELSYLKSQINPHFLFNTLNNIHALAYKQSPVAPDAIMRLSSLMRYMLYESNADVVPLSKEIEYIHDYINLQQLRYEEKLIVDFQIKGNVNSCQVAPLLFIHLLENAYKHSPAVLEAGAIKMSLVVKENCLTFSIQNPVKKKKIEFIQEPGGIGINNFQKRLQLLYPHQHKFKFTSVAGCFNAILEIDLSHLQNHERKANLLYN